MCWGDGRRHAYHAVTADLPDPASDPARSGVTAGSGVSVRPDPPNRLRVEILEFFELREETRVFSECFSERVPTRFSSDLSNPRSNNIRALSHSSTRVKCEPRREAILGFSRNYARVFYISPCLFFCNATVPSVPCSLSRCTPGSLAVASGERLSGPPSHSLQRRG